MCYYFPKLQCFSCFFFFFKQKTAYEIGTGDWSSDVCSSDLGAGNVRIRVPQVRHGRPPIAHDPRGERIRPAHAEIGRASCRERV